jgi:hypothetical protein
MVVAQIGSRKVTQLRDSAPANIASGHSGNDHVRQRFDTAESDPVIHLAFAVKAKFPCYISHFVAVLID